MALEDTKERAVPHHPAQTLEDYLVYLKHVALYDFAKSFAAQKTVLDLGCGEGYGSAALAQSARFVVAADYSFEVVAHASEKYAQENLAFVVCDAQRLPFRSDTFGAVISFEVIEHIENVRAYLGEIKRVGVGSALISTPNRLLRLLPFQKPWNRFHKREYDARGLARVLGAAFPRVQMRGVTAEPEILAIEKRRVKQNPLTAYPKMVAQLLLPRGVYDQIKRAVPSVTLSAAKGLTRGKEILRSAQNDRQWAKDDKQVIGGAEFNAAGFSANDFEISETELRECINLLAICER